MKTKKWILLLFLFAGIMGCETIRIDEGGWSTDYIQSIRRTQKTGEAVVIDYACYSACAILLSSGSGLRVSKRATFGIHEARHVLPNGYYYDSTSKRSEINTKEFKSLLPACAVRLFETKQAFDTGNITKFTGEEVLQACAGEIQEYVE